MTGATIAVIGSGAWGTTLAALAAGNGHAARLLFRSADEAETVRRERRHPRAMPGLTLPPGVTPVTEIAEAVRGVDLVILAVPSQAMRDAVRRLAPALAAAPVLSVSKGIEIASLQRMSQVIAEELRAFGGRAASAPVAVLSGPNLSAEIAVGRPALAVVASADPAAARTASDLLRRPAFRTYTSDDVVGVELGGALKNVYAIGAGIGAGMAVGDNARAAYITRAIAEMTRLGIAAGADPATFPGIAGLGDLIATCSSEASRNHRLGRELAAGRTLDDALASLHHVAEGVTTTVAVRHLSRRLGVGMPIAEQMHRVLFEGLPAHEAVLELMGREPRDERSSSGYAPPFGRR